MLFLYYFVLLSKKVAEMSKLDKNTLAPKKQGCFTFCCLSQIYDLFFVHYHRNLKHFAVCVGFKHTAVFFHRF